MIPKTLLAALLLVALVGTSHAGPFRTDVVAATSPTLSITVQDGRFLRIINFVHQGNGPGIAHLARNGQAADVMYSTAVGVQETHRNFFIAGPATLTVAPVAATTLTITFQLDQNDGD